MIVQILTGFLCFNLSYKKHQKIRNTPILNCIRIQNKLHSNKWSFRQFKTYQTKNTFMEKLRSKEAFISIHNSDHPTAQIRKIISMKITSIKWTYLHWSQVKTITIVSYWRKSTKLNKRTKNKALKSQIEWENPFSIRLMNPIMRYFSTILMIIFVSKESLIKMENSFLFTAFMKIKVLTWTQVLYKPKVYLSSDPVSKKRQMNLKSNFCLMKNQIETIV